MASNSSEPEANIVFTVGHSNHTLDHFLSLLTQHQVTALADVRSSPYSRFNPQFNREKLATSLRNIGIKYVYLGSQLGGRSDDASCYEHGRIRYERLARKPEFEEGIKRVIAGAENYRIALTCAEKEPLSCHRTLLVGHELTKRGIPVRHILSDGSIESHENAMTRLLTQLDLLTKDDLFVRSKKRNELISEAISYQTERVGHAIETDTFQNQVES